MISKVISKLNSEIRGLHEAAYILGLLTIVSTILALLRDRLFAHVFGASAILDVYNAAFKIPDLIFVMIASLVSAFVLIPALAEKKLQNSERSFLRTITAVTGAVLITVSVTLIFVVPYILPYFFPSLFERGYGKELILMTQILLIQPIILGISNIASSVVQFYGRYTLYALAPVLYNLGIMFGAYVLYPFFGVGGLATGVVTGALLHLGVQAPFFVAHGLSKTSIDAGFGKLKDYIRVITFSIPRTLSLSLGNITLLIIIMYAATLKEGSIALFTFAFNLQAAPLAIIGASYSVAAFPTLSRLYRANAYEEFVSHITTASRHIIFWSLPFLALCIVLRAHIVRAVLGSGAFSWSDTRVTAAAFALFAVSLTSQALSMLFIRGYYAAERTTIPLAISIVSSVVSVVSAITLVQAYQSEEFFRYFLHSLLRLADTDDASVALLALGFAIGTTVSVMAHMWFFSRTFISVPLTIGRSLREGFVAAVFAGFGSYLVLAFFSTRYSLDTFLSIVAQAGVATIVGSATAALILYLLGNTEVREVYKALHGSFRKVSIRGIETTDASTTL